MNDKTETEIMIASEFHVKKCSIYLFFVQRVLNLIVSIVKKIDSLPFWLMISTIICYVLMIVMVKLYGDDKKY
jgi:hypothetical protein